MLQNVTYFIQLWHWWSHDVECDLMDLRTNDMQGQTSHIASSKLQIAHLTSFALNDTDIIQMVIIHSHNWTTGIIYTYFITWDPQTVWKSLCIAIIYDTEVMSKIWILDKRKTILFLDDSFFFLLFSRCMEKCILLWKEV